MRSTSSFFLSSMALACAASAMPAQAADLSIAVAGVVSNEGKVRVALFDKESNFPKGKILMGQAQPASKGTMNFAFKGVAPGQYAASAFQDMNDNERLDTNMMGIPSEPYGFSRDARGVMGPPTFNETAFTLGAEPTHLTVHLK
jgi:uncharacterized protein (DUF2141 family)